MKFKYLTLLFVMFFSTFFLSACGKKNTTPAPQPTPTPRLVEISPEKRPYISLIPRADGHELKLSIDRLDPSIKEIEYELIYKAVDENLEIEKGVSGNLTAQELEKDLLLGTASCTNGCKYKYDAGVTGGVLSLTLTTTDNQVSFFETPFSLYNSADLKTSQMSLEGHEITIDTTPSASSEYFVLLQNYKPNTYSVFSSGNGKGKINSISPDTLTKESKTIITGDYLQP